MELSRSGLGRSSFLMKRQKLLAWRTLVRGRLASKSCFEFVLRNRRKVSCSWSFFGSHLLPQVFDLLRQVGVFSSIMPRHTNLRHTHHERRKPSHRFPPFTSSFGCKIHYARTIR